MYILSATCYVTDILKKDWRQKLMWLLISPPTRSIMLLNFLFYLFLPFFLGSLHLLVFSLQFFPKLYAYSSVPLQTSLPFFVPAAPHSFRGRSSRFEWTCLGSTRHPPWKRNHCWPFLSITVFQAVPLCCKGSRTVMLSATDSYMHQCCTHSLSFWSVFLQP